MNFTTISHATGISTDNLLKAWKNAGLYEGKSPGPTGALPADKVAPFLEWIGAPKTRRKDGPATQVAATLLAEFRAGQHQNGHVDTRKEYAPVANPGVKMVVPDQHFKPGAEFKKPVQHRTRTAKQPDAQPITPEPVKRRFTWPQVGMLDIVYLSTIATAVYGLWFTLREMGAAFAVPYCLISWHALRMAKNPASRSTAQVGIAAVVVLEVLTFFVHLVLFNLRTVQAAKAGVLPFEYSFYGSLEMPFVIACILAGLFSAAGIYAVSVTFLGTSEKHALAEKAKRDAEQSAAHVTELRAALEDAAKQWAIASGQNHFDTEKAGTLAERYYTVLKQTAANGG